MLHYFPLALPFLLILFFLFIFLIIMIEVGILGYAYQTIGIDRRYVFLLLLLCFWGSYINIPVYRLPPEIVQSGGQVTFFGIPYIIPIVTRWPGTVIAINVGGAGTFDGIFTTGILAVLLAGLITGKRTPA